MFSSTLRIGVMLDINVIVEGRIRCHDFAFILSMSVAMVSDKGFSTLEVVFVGLTSITLSDCNSINACYVPPARKLVFPLRLRVAQCCVFRYRGMKCKN